MEEVVCTLRSTSRRGGVRLLKLTATVAAKRKYNWPLYTINVVDVVVGLGTCTVQLPTASMDPFPSNNQSCEKEEEEEV